MAKTVAERLAENRKKRAMAEMQAEKREGSSVAERLAKNRQKRLVSADTIDADLKSLNESLSSTFGGWQDAETLKSTKSSLESMVGRLDAYKQHLTGRADEETLSQISSIRDDYSKVLEGFDQYTESYGKYSSLDEWNRALKEAEAAEVDRKALLDYDQVAGQAEIDELQNVLTKYYELQSQLTAANRGYGSEQKKNNLRAQMNALVAEYGGIEGLSSLISEKNAYHTLAGRAQKGAELSSVVGNEDFDANSGYVSTKLNPKTFLDKLKGSEYGMGYGDLTYEYINGDASLRDQINQAYYESAAKAGGNFAFGTDTPFTKRSLDEMNEDEIKVYNYYYNTEGKEKAEEFLDSIVESLNYRRKQSIFESVEGKTGLEMVFGIVAGLDQYAGGVEALLSNKDYIPTSAWQYASGMVREDLADNGAKLPDWLGGSSLGQVAYDAITTTSNMLPSIVLSFVPVVGQAVGTVSLGASAAGHAKAEMLNLGYSKGQANLYGAMVGASEAGLQYLLGGITRLGGKLPQGLTELAVSKVDNAIARVAITLGMNMASEGLEESLQTVIEPWLKSLVTGVDFEAPDIDEVLYSGLLGAVSSLLMEGGSTVYGEVAKKHEASAVYGENAADLVAEALEINPNDAYALKMKALLDEGKTLTGGQINRLIKGNEKSLRGQESAEIKTAAAESLTELGETGNIGTERINEKAHNKDLYSFAEEVAGVEKNAAVAPQAFAPQTQTSSVAENTSKKENATEGKFEASADGKTRVGDTEVSVKEIASIKGGEMLLRLEDGSTVKASDVEFGSSDEALLYENVLDMGLNAARANAFLRGYDGKLSAEMYALGFREAYQYGEYGVPESELSQEGFLPDLSEVQRHLAYNLGKANAEARVAEQQRKASKSAKSESRKGKLHNTLTPTNETQRASLKALGVVAEALGIDIYTFESSLVNGKRQGANGWYDPSDNSIHIDLFAGIDGKGTMLFTAAHELTHHIRAKLPAKFKAFADFLFEKYGEKGISVSELVAKKQAFLKEKGRITAAMTEAQAYDLAYEEVVADSCESFLADGDAIAKIAELKAKEKRLWQTIKDFITKLVTRIKAAYGGLSPDTVEGRLTAEMLDAAEELKAMWTEMLVETSEVSDVDEGNVKNETASPLFSERDFPIDEEVEKTVDDAFKTPKSSMLILSDITSDQNKAINRLVNQTNNDLYRGRFTGGKHRFLDTIVRHVIREHGDFLREGLRAQLPMKPVDIARHLSAVKANKEPNKTIPTKTKEGTPSILTAFEVNGYTLYAEEIIRPLGKNLPSDLIGHTMYKAPTLPSATFYTTSVQTQPKRQSMVLCNYYSTNSTNLSTGNFVADSNNLPALLNYISLNGTPKQDARSAGLIALSSDKSNFTDQTGDVRQGYVRCKKPFYITSENRVFSNSETDISARIEELKKQGYDCFIFEQKPGDNYMVAVVNKAQIVKDQPKVVYSDRVTDSVSNRTLLADALVDAGENYQNVREVLGEDSAIEVNEMDGARAKKLSDRAPYSYETLTSKLPIEVKLLAKVSVAETNKYKANTTLFGKEMREIATKTNNPRNTPTSTYLYCKDLDEDVQITRDSFKHGAERMDADYIAICKNISSILENSIVVNEVSPRSDTNGGYVLLGLAETADSYIVVRSIVNKKTWKLDDYKELSAIKKRSAKKGDAGLKPPHYLPKKGYGTSPMISIADFLEFVNSQKLANSVLSLDVIGKLGATREIDPNVTPNLHYSDRSPNSVSNRTLLADALESTVKDEVERKRLGEYKAAIAEIESAQEQLTELRAKIKEMSFATGPRDTKAINALRFEANKLANRISVLDGRLLRLESMGAIKGVLAREKARAYEKAKQEGKEALAAYRKRAEQKQKDLAAHYQESRKKGVEGRHKTEMRHKIKSIVSELNQLLLHGSKERNVKPALRSAVASALEAVNMDTLEVEKRVAELNSSIEKATDPVVAEALAEKRDRIQKQGDTLSVRLAELKAAYEQIKAKPESEIDGQLSLDADIIIAKVESVSKLIGDTPIRSMTLFQLEAVYDMYRMVLKTIQNVNKVFRAGKEEDLLLNVKAVEKELGAIPKLKEERLAEASKLEAFSWNELMPVYAFERIGSATFKKFYWDFIKAQNVYAIDGEEAKAFAENVRKKYNYASWDMNKVYEFPLADGRTLRATLKHMLSIYAYSKREQALEHMAKGGFFFDDKETFTTTLGGVLKFNKSNEVGYQIDADTLGAIQEAMSKEQLQYVDEMQAYLSEVMADKGNAVSRVLWGIDIFKEKVYFPLRSKEDFLKRANETAANISLKNDGMTKETVPGASNPIVLEAFDEVWAGHVERMAQYHAFVLPIDNMNKVHQYGTWNGASISISTMLGSRHGSAANDYIRQFIKDMNGSVMSGGVKAPGVEMFNKFKKTAVAASLSVVVQQPTAIIRATALIDPKYFLGSKVKSSEGKDLEEMRKYAPISVLKEIGGFDAGSGRTLVDYINGDTKRGVDKAMAVIDDISMKGAELGDRVGWLTIWNAVKREVASKNKGIATSSEQFLSLVGERFTEVIVYTQVYDSTLSRSAFMRSKRDLTKMMTSFMGEPTLSYNMMANALYQLKRHTMKKSQAARTISSVLVSTTLASLAASFIYGLRDDDDEKTLLEKWLRAFGMDMLGVVEINGFKIPLVASNLLPHNMLPWFRDAVSLLEGWDVERADMSVLADVWKAIDGLDSEKKSAWRKVEDMASIASMFGIPLKNAMRTFREMYNLLNGFVS